MVLAVSGPFPRSWGVGSRADVRDHDDALCRVWDALEADDADDWDRVEQTVNPLLDALIEVGYVEQWGHSPTGCFWAISLPGHERLRKRGRDA
jgi:hypothetical protein